MEAGANKDKMGLYEGRWNQTAWHVAAKNGCQAVVELLLGPKSDEFTRVNLFTYGLDQAGEA